MTVQTKAQLVAALAAKTSACIGAQHAYEAQVAECNRLRAENAAQAARLVKAEAYFRDISVAKPQRTSAWVKPQWQLDRVEAMRIAKAKAMGIDA